MNLPKWVKYVSEIAKSEESEPVIDEVEPLAKGDLQGHEFHGNQWIDGAGRFNPNAGGGKRAAAAPARVRAPRVPRAPKPKPAPAPKPAPKPVPKPTPPPVVQSPPPAPPQAPKVEEAPVKENKLFMGFGATTEIDHALTEKQDKGGFLNAGLQEVLLKDGEKGIVKSVEVPDEVGGTEQWRKELEKQLVGSEVLAAKIGKAIDAPIRDCVQVGKSNDILMPYIEGKNWENVPNVTFDPSLMDSRGFNPEVKQQLTEMRFFDALIGGADRNGGNLMVTNPQGIYDLSHPDTRVIGIDHGIAFDDELGGKVGFGFPPSVERIIASATLNRIPLSRATDMYNSLIDLRDNGALNFDELAKVTAIGEGLRIAVNTGRIR